MSRSHSGPALADLQASVLGFALFVLGVGLP